MSETGVTPSIGVLFSSPDPDDARKFFESKSRQKINKVMSVREAVSQFIHDGDYFASGGFGSVRISTAVLHEMLRQKKKDLGFAGHTSTHDFQILAAGKCFNRCDSAYIVGLEMRGLPLNARRYMESGAVQVTEWSNAALGWRLKAAAMGLPYLPSRTMLGTDTFKYSAAKEVVCPFTGEKLAAVPALFPDVSVIHVHRADIYGNAQFDGVSVADSDLARATKRLIITTERLVDTAEICRAPEKTQIPYWLVDAVCLVPYGSYPGNMPYEYYFDEKHLLEWIDAEKEETTFERFLQKFIYGTDDFSDYLQLVGGETRMGDLRNLEPLRRN
jgi:glutaconate CoA-transferase, subunit A